MQNYNSKFKTSSSSPEAGEVGRGMNKYMYNSCNNKLTRQRLRNNMPAPESILWNRIRAKQLGGLKFRRQYGVGPFVLDFYCPEIRLAIEIDGDSHYSAKGISKDKEREKFLNNIDIQVLRFKNDEVIEKTEGVLARISAFSTVPNPSYSRRGEV